MELPHHNDFVCEFWAHISNGCLVLVRGGRLEVFGRRRRPCFYMHNLNNPTPFMVDDDGSTTIAELMSLEISAKFV